MQLVELHVKVDCFGDPLCINSLCHTKSIAVCPCFRILKRERVCFSFLQISILGPVRTNPAKPPNSFPQPPHHAFLPLRRCRCRSAMTKREGVPLGCKQLLLYAVNPSLSSLPPLLAPFPHSLSGSLPSLPHILAPFVAPSLAPFLASFPSLLAHSLSRSLS